MSADARDLIGGLCTVDVTKRLGNVKGGAATVKKHPWFKDVDWDAMYHRRTQGPIVPHLRSNDDTRNFDEYDAEPVHRDEYTKVSPHGIPCSALWRRKCEQRASVVSANLPC
jgi:hypothetical protein